MGASLLASETPILRAILANRRKTSIEQGTLAEAGFRCGQSSKRIFLEVFSIAGILILT
jgi:hypothetical protein